MASKLNIPSDRRKQLIEFQDRYLKGIHQFKDLSLLDQCLTHNSYRGEGGKYVANFKSLEWIGDRAMGLVITDHVFASNPDTDERTRERMNKGRTELENNDLLKKILKETLDIDKYILYGQGHEKEKFSNHGDFVEALIGAVYVDCKKQNVKDWEKKIRELMNKYWMDKDSNRVQFRTISSQ